MNIYQQTISLPEKGRGFHLITDEVEQALPEITHIATGLCQVFIQHTSASLTINENAAMSAIPGCNDMMPSVCPDAVLRRYLLRSVPIFHLITQAERNRPCRTDE